MNPFDALLADLRKLRMDVGLDGDLNSLAERRAGLVDPSGKPVRAPRPARPAKPEPAPKDEPERGREPDRERERERDRGRARKPTRGDIERKGVEFLDDVFRKIGKRRDSDFESDTGSYPKLGRGTFVTSWDREHDFLIAVFISDEEEKAMVYTMKIEKTEDEMKDVNKALDVSEEGYEAAVDAATAFVRKLS